MMDQPQAAYHSMIEVDDATQENARIGYLVKLTFPPGAEFRTDEPGEDPLAVNECERIGEEGIPESPIAIYWTLNSTSEDLVTNQLSFDASPMDMSA